MNPLSLIQYGDNALAYHDGVYHLSRPAVPDLHRLAGTGILQRNAFGLKLHSCSIDSNKDSFSLADQPRRLEHAFIQYLASGHPLRK